MTNEVDGPGHICLCRFSKGCRRLEGDARLRSTGIGSGETSLFRRFAYFGRVNGGMAQGEGVRRAYGTRRFPDSAAQMAALVVGDIGDSGEHIGLPSPQPMAKSAVQGIKPFAISLAQSSMSRGQWAPCVSPTRAILHRRVRAKSASKTLSEIL